MGENQAEGFVHKQATKIGKSLFWGI